MEKNLLNTTLTINDLRSIKANMEEHKKELNNLFELVNEITPTEKINGTRLFIFIHSITMF